MPDLTLTFVNPRLFDDVSFHPCVRFKRWEVSAIHHTSNVSLLKKYFYVESVKQSFIILRSYNFIFLCIILTLIYL